MPLPWFSGITFDVDNFRLLPMKIRAEASARASSDSGEIGNDEAYVASFWHSYNKHAHDLFSEQCALLLQFAHDYINVERQVLMTALSVHDTYFFGNPGLNEPKEERIKAHLQAVLAVPFHDVENTRQVSLQYSADSMKDAKIAARRIECQLEEDHRANIDYRQEIQRLDGLLAQYSEKKPLRGDAGESSQKARASKKRSHDSL